MFWIQLQELYSITGIDKTRLASSWERHTHTHIHTHRLRNPFELDAVLWGFWAALTTFFNRFKASSFLFLDCTVYLLINPSSSSSLFSVSKSTSMFDDRCHKRPSIYPCCHPLINLESPAIPPPLSVSFFFFYSLLSYPQTFACCTSLVLHL